MTSSSFCFNCGSKLPSVQETYGLLANAPEPEVQRPPTGRSKRTITIVAGCAILIALAMVAGIIARNLNESAQPGLALTNSLPTPTPIPSPTPYWAKHSVKVGRDVLALPARQLHQVPFEVDPAWRNVQLVGRFTAQGGWGNDVEVLVTDEDGVVNYQNGHKYRNWYASGKVTADTLSVPLPAGKFVLIISNTFSLLSQKSVQMNFRLNYESLHQP